MKKKDIKNFIPEELKTEIKGLGEPSYRANQVLGWLYQKNAQEFDDMSNLPAVLRGKLNNYYEIGKIYPEKHLISKDGTEKFLFRLSDRNYIESVLIRSRERNTLCISTQAGCKFSCLFCASGMRGFIRNLTPSEIVNQLLYVKHTNSRDITNIVFMGMGEPLDNYDNLIKAILILNSPHAINMASRRISISTAGIPSRIKELAVFKPQINLSLSIHATVDTLRNNLMPINKKYPLSEIVDAAEEYLKATNRKIMIEYILFKNLNDSLKDAQRLSGIAKRLKAEVNLMAFHPIEKTGLMPPEPKDIHRFMKWLKDNGSNVSLRMSKGEDIQAACGQLAGRAGLRINPVRNFSITGREDF